jgi:hypothetical protein
LDGLFEARDPSVHRDVVLEIKLWSEPGVLSMRQYADSLLATVARYQAIADRSAIGWLLMVVPGDEPSDKSFAKAENRVTERLAPAGSATIIQESELDHAGERFNDLLTLESLIRAT